MWIARLQNEDKNLRLCVWRGEFSTEVFLA